MIETTKILKEKEETPTIPSTLEAIGRLVHEPSFGRGRAPMSHRTQKKLGWVRSGMLERVVYLDDREQVLETNEYPWCLITFLEIDFPLGTGIGTGWLVGCLLYTSPSPRDQRGSRMPSSA